MWYRSLVIIVNSNGILRVELASYKAVLKWAKHEDFYNKLAGLDGQQAGSKNSDACRVCCIVY